MKCYKCVSTKSYGDCDDIRKEMTCGPGFDRCYKGSVSIKGGGASVDEFEKGCLTEIACSNIKDSALCKDKVKCEVSCCTGDFCNTAPTQAVSFVFLTICVLVALTQ